MLTLPTVFKHDIIDQDVHSLRVCLIQYRLVKFGDFRPLAGLCENRVGNISRGDDSPNTKWRSPCDSSKNMATSGSPIHHIPFILYLSWRAVTVFRAQRNLNH